MMIAKMIWKISFSRVSDDTLIRIHFEDVGKNSTEVFRMNGARP